VKEKAKRHAQDQIKEKWEEKQMHGQYPKIKGEKDVDHQMKNQGLKTVGLTSETYGFYHRYPRPDHQEQLQPEQNPQR